ncbi:meiosis expressed protein 1 -like [Brachionus plicatilis]|uniref:Meiosis expressed protein 1-like n=1 Tax=Brachionus plicatilis TaxID=10195 RepID=A0A3M7R809_BRAPC|nr:meiosis expressed protein 1 -like [Brachionus plicatilis]
MADLQVQQPKSLIRPKSWSAEVEDAYRFQLAGYRDELEYIALTKADVPRWPETGFVKKLQRKKDGYFYYYNRARECSDKDIHKCKIYVY